ncbi:MAG: VCBS repeat-containing protein [Chitinophagaceae bacterium]|nr:VCBS repeat-containing protein [Chitinophagaceae bacterium]
MHTNIHFNNQITESDSINPLDMEFLYNGGGVAVGDFNKDGLPDLYFTASQVSNKMYLNKGKLAFEEITEKAGVTGEGRWSNAASVVDINNDGWPDIYVCATINKDPSKRANLLYINQGPDKSGVPQFKEMAAAYNLADTGFSVHAAFFDYDRDGDLDMYLVTTTLAQRNSTRFDGGGDDNRIALSDKLYRNEDSDSLGHPWFTNVSLQAGIADEGYGLGIAIADINKDGWKDIYVTNDFYGSDLLYINNRDGTFSDKARVCFKHTAQNAMGNDIADINNDGLADIISVDMNPEDNYRKKKNMNGMNYFIHEQLAQNGVQQYVRNTLQLNNGLVAYDTSKQLLPSFSDISFYAGVAETDWSWNPSLADFDNDGFKDLLITNGYPRDVTDHDFAAYRSKAFKTASKKELMDQIPQIKISNYAFRNTGQLQFENVTNAWGLNLESFSNGAVYADLDNDGDLDYVINNINEKAFVYENNSHNLNKNNYLNIRFNGSSKNINGIGAIADIYYNQGLMQTFENSPYRGYLSTVDNYIHFGVGAEQQIDSVVITWPDGKKERLMNVPVNQTLAVSYKNALVQPAGEQQAYNTLFTNTTIESGIDYRHQEFDYIDFNTQKLLPHKFSQFGPSIAAGDLNGDGLDDLFIGASASNTATILYQQTNRKFIEKALTSFTGTDIRRPEMMGVLLFDADGDGDLDIYACSGSNEFAPGTKNYQDQFYISTGKGNFLHDTLAIPKNLSSKSCIKAADYDNDGDLDLFIGGRLNPTRYPEPVSSYIYRNDTKDGKIKFTDVTDEVAPVLKNIGLVCDVVWTDFDNDGQQDLLIAGEWMPLTFLKNDHGKFTNNTAATGLQNKTGWWTSIVSGDFDNDGDMDYVAGNVGLNSFFKASEKEPVSIYAADFEGDQAYDAIPALYLPDQDGNRKEFPAHVRDDMVKQMISTRRKFQNYKSYAVADMKALLPPEEMQKALVLKANYLASAYIQNNGNNQFELKPLPLQTQLAPLNGMVAEDVNGDGSLDLVINGNDYGNEVVNGQYDAMNGLVLLGNGKGDFEPMSIQQSGYFVPGDAKGLATLAVGNRMAVAATQNRKKLQLFTLKEAGKMIRYTTGDVSAILHLTNGKQRKLEITYGTSFLSQSSRFTLLNNMIDHIDILNRKGEKRTINAKSF